MEGHVEDLKPERASRLGLPGGIMAEVGEREGEKGGEAASGKAL